jgi:hypothetical protein
MRASLASPCLQGDALNEPPPRMHKFIRFGDSYGPKPYKFIGFGDSPGPKLHKFIRFGDSYGPGFIGPKPHKFIWFGDCYGPNPDKIKKGLVRAMAPNQDCYQEKTEIGLPAGRRPAGGPMSVFSR